MSLSSTNKAKIYRFSVKMYFYNSAYIFRITWALKSRCLFLTDGATNQLNYIAKMQCKGRKEIQSTQKRSNYLKLIYISSIKSTICGFS